MLVSVVIPTFNRARYLGEAIQSVLLQSYRELQVIVVDDGSTDDTGAVVRTISDPRVRYIYQENRGVAAALNTGWRAARGAVIGRLDSDDAWLPELLAALVPYLEGDPSLGVVYARARGMDEHGRPLSQLIGAPEKFPGATLKSLLYSDFVAPTAVIYRRACIEQIGGYDESLPGTEDWDAWIRMAEHCRFGFVPRVLARYRFHGGNATGANSPRALQLLRDRERVLEKYYARSALPPEALAIRPIAFANLHMDLAIRHLNARRWRPALCEYVRSLRAAPHPATFAARLVWVTLYYVFLSKWSWSVKLVDGLVRLRRRWARR